jgi:hypothetical protein
VFGGVIWLELVSKEGNITHVREWKLSILD